MFKKALFIAALSGAIITGLVAPAQASSANPKCDVLVSAMDDLNAVLESSPAGAVLCIDAGIHKLSKPLMPKDGQSILGEQGAVLSGSRLLGSFTRSNDVWFIDGQTQQGNVGHHHPDYRMCAPRSYEGCRFADAVFLDDAPLWRVTSLNDVASGRFYFDYEADRIYIGNNPTGRKVEASVTSQAIVANGSVDVTVQGLVIEKFANPAQSAAISGGSGWTISGNEVRLNHGIGICVQAASKVVANNVHHNGQMGLCGSGANILVEDNEIAYNNTAGFSSLWEAGGTKWVETDGLIVRNNFSHHNIGPGLWTDINNINTTYEGNTVEDNVGPGIMHEISYAAVIRNNTISRNGFGYSYWAPAGILIIDSPNVEVAKNTLIGNRSGVAILQDERVEGRYGSLEVRNVKVHDNSISTKGWSGFQTWTQRAESLLELANVKFLRNDYHVSSSTSFYWGQKKLGIKEWRRIGHDRASTFAESV